LVKLKEVKMSEVKMSIPEIIYLDYSIFRNIFSFRSLNLPNTSSRIRVNLVPYTPYYSPFYEDNVNDKKIKKISDYSTKKNQHVSHLPSYYKLKETNKENEYCSICYEEFKKNEYCRKLPLCGHFFHKKCVDKWLRKDILEMRCPLCRKSHTQENFQGKHIELTNE
jgi:hypothetical protein